MCVVCNMIIYGSYIYIYKCSLWYDNIWIEDYDSNKSQYDIVYINMILICIYSQPNDPVDGRIPTPVDGLSHYHSILYSAS